jgi:hypothetical protein
MSYFPKTQYGSTQNKRNIVQQQSQITAPPSADWYSNYVYSLMLRITLWGDDKLIENITLRIIRVSGKNGNMMPSLHKINSKIVDSKILRPKVLGNNK